MPTLALLGTFNASKALASLLADRFKSKNDQFSVVPSLKKLIRAIL